MKISILTLFPDIFLPVLSSSILGRAQKKNLLNVRLINIRDFSNAKYRSVDDKPYGGGVGMILRVDILASAIQYAKDKNIKTKAQERIVLLDPAGIIFTQKKAREYTKLDHLILVCGHYEGVDARINYFVDESISIGEYILTGGELPAMVVTDAVTRLVPGVLQKIEATKQESFRSRSYIEAPQYTRPSIFSGLHVPKILLSGHHSEIIKWRQTQAEIRKTTRKK